MHLIKKTISAFILIIISNQSFANGSISQEERKHETETYQIGEMIQNLQDALITRDQKSLQTISLYGTDSRYYSMIRGWLFQELVGVESQLHASREKKQSEKFQNHSNFLKKAIRLIDLE